MWCLSMCHMVHTEACPLAIKGFQKVGGAKNGFCLARHLLATGALAGHIKLSDGHSGSLCPLGPRSFTV